MEFSSVGGDGDCNYADSTLGGGDLPPQSDNC